MERLVAPMLLLFIHVLLPMETGTVVYLLEKETV